MKYDYNLLVAWLQRSELNVTFTKLDGTTRTMRCTLMKNFLPEEYRGRSPMLVETTPVTVSVWDLDAAGWRSFRLENVTDVIQVNPTK
jgi:hypothetical protein